jgi:hypothetical protein
MSATHLCIGLSVPCMLHCPLVGRAGCLLVQACGYTAATLSTEPMRCTVHRVKISRRGERLVAFTAHAVCRDGAKDTNYCETKLQS